eukprot:11223661-Lingulodinium_polyedra.AAC.1
MELWLFSLIPMLYRVWVAGRARDVAAWVVVWGGSVGARGPRVRFGVWRSGSQGRGGRRFHRWK